jgi:hypothetical protein
VQTNVSGKSFTVILLNAASGTVTVGWFLIN